MAELLKSVAEEVSVCILTARDPKVCERDIIDPLRAVDAPIDQYILGCSNGSEIYQYHVPSQEYQCVSRLTGMLCSDRVFQEVVAQIRAILQSNDVYYEPRSATLGTIVCMRRDASCEDRKSFDPDKTKRQRCIEAIRPLFPQEYEIVAGGATSIDISLYDKAAGMQHLLDVL